MNNRKARGSAGARRTESPSRRLGGHNTGRTQGRDRNEPSTSDNQLSDDIAQEHEAQVNQLRDEPVPSSHYDDRPTEQRNADEQ